MTSKSSKPLSQSAEEFVPSAARPRLLPYFAPPPFTAAATPYIKPYFPAQPLHYYCYPYYPPNTPAPFITPCYFIKTPTSNRNASLFTARQINSLPLSGCARKETQCVDAGYAKGNNNSFGFKFGRNKFPSRFRRSNQIFNQPAPKKKLSQHPTGNQRSSPTSKPESYDHKRNGTKTTLMIRNIPNQLRRHELLHFLKTHCQNQNEKEKSDSVEIEFDFLYLPMDFRKHKNLGYAFVNWTSAEAAVCVREMLNNWKWSPIYPSAKVCKIDWGRIQGKDALVSRFTNTYFECVDVEYLPIVLCSTPPSSENGTGESKEFVTVGRCVPPPCDRARSRVRFKGRV